MASARSHRKLAAIMFTDIVGYTALMAESERRGLRARERHRRLVGSQVARYGGDPIEVRGDECLSVFPSAADAVNCALAIQVALEGEEDLALHVGIHLGDVVLDAGEVSGDGVNIASRVCGLSEEGGLRVSAEVYHAVRNLPNLEAAALGERELKNVGRPVAVYALTGAPLPPSTTARERRLARAGRKVAAALAIAALVAGAAWLWRVQTAGAGPIRSIAVLPLENLSGDPEQDYFADGMTESLIGDLAKLGSLRVISRTSVMRYKGVQRALPEIADELRVDAVVEGSIQLMGERVRIHAQLIDARTDHHLWAEQYDRDVRDVLTLQREVTRAIAREIELTLTPRERAGLADARPVAPAAHAAYLKGRYFQRRGTAEGTDRAIEYFDRAISIDPEFALAYAGKADTYSCAPMHAWTMPQSGEWPALPYQVMEHASAAARTALELDPDLGESHVALALVRLFGEWSWAEAEAEFQRALELNPGNSFAYEVYAHELGLLGRFDEALERNARARELDPLAVMYLRQLGILQEWLGELEAARHSFEMALELDPDFAQAHQGLGRSLCQSGRIAEALVAFQRARALGPLDPMIAADMGHCFAVSERPEEARQLLAELNARPGRQHLSPVSLALIHLGLGEHDAALEQLERAYEVRAWHLPSIARDRRWTTLRSDPRFADLLRRIGLAAS